MELVFFNDLMSLKIFPLIKVMLQFQSERFDCDRLKWRALHSGIGFVVEEFNWMSSYIRINLKPRRVFDSSFLRQCLRKFAIQQTCCRISSYSSRDRRRRRSTSRSRSRSRSGGRDRGSHSRRGSTYRYNHLVIFVCLILNVT